VFVSVARSVFVWLRSLSRRICQLTARDQPAAGDIFLWRKIRTPWRLSLESSMQILLLDFLEVDWREKIKLRRCCAQNAVLREGSANRNTWVRTVGVINGSRCLFDDALYWSVLSQGVLYGPIVIKPAFNNCCQQRLLTWGRTRGLSTY